MKLRLVLAFGVSSLACSSAAAFAGEQPPLPRDAVAKVARGLCMAEGRSIGKDAFLTKYGSFDACVQAKTEEAQQVVDACRSATQPTACIAQQLGVAPRETAPGDNAARSVAAQLCIAELRKLGEVAFKAKYGTKDACLDQSQQQAQELLQRCKSTPDPRACVQQALGDRKPGADLVARAKERCRGAADPRACVTAVLKGATKPRR